ncbi:MAG: LysM peptidoglycan-binding domain-containing protein, partial [Actinobacteria bacterium]|nr:LysM peptidoglycan-binding domain-containing protein [Actinomycetota bacterium]
MRSTLHAHRRHGEDPPPRRLRRLGTTLLLAVLLTGGLVVPATSSQAARRVHVVHRGDTLSALARRHRVRGGWRAMYRANRSRLRRPGLVRVGQRLRVPRGGARRAHRAHRHSPRRLG